MSDHLIYDVDFLLCFFLSFQLLGLSIQSSSFRIQSIVEDPASFTNSHQIFVAASFIPRSIFPISSPRHLRTIIQFELQSEKTLFHHAEPVDTKRFL